LFHNSNIFGSCIIHILYTECAKIKKIIPAHNINILCLFQLLEMVFINRGLFCRNNFSDLFRPTERPSSGRRLIQRNVFLV